MICKTRRDNCCRSKNKREEVKHVYSDINKRWNKKEYFEDNASVKDDKNLEPTNSF